MPAKRLLIVTQSVDSSDPQFSFFIRWIEEIAKHFEKVKVVCLKEGKHALPENVSVHSLGKEEGASRGKYVKRLYWYSLRFARQYDAVFVHQNQEYVILAAWLWHFLGKKVYLWRNHWAGGLFTRLAVKFSDKVFCTSNFSYTAKFNKNVIMPVGVDTALFTPVEAVRRSESILSLGRIAPSKRLELIVEALAILRESGYELKAHFYGNTEPQDFKYEQTLMRRVKELRVDHLVVFHPGVQNAQTPALYSGHEFFINCSESGMYDKTIFEALACQSLTIACSKDYAEIADPRLIFEGTARDLALKLKELLKLPDAEKNAMRESGRKLSETQSLSALAEKIAAAL